MLVKTKNPPSAYSHYREWKRWGDVRPVSRWQAQYFAGELSRARPARFASVLEIGFGNGEFLQWAAAQGVKVAGLEIIPELVEAARTRGFEAHLCNLVEQDPAEGPLAGRTFDCIVLFDVLEHLPVEEGILALQRLRYLLAPGGRIILRFPNGDSPFAAPIQNGDHTHRNAIARSKLEQMCVGTGLKVRFFGNSFRVANKRSTAWLKWVIFRLRDLTEFGIGFLYFNRRRPLDPVATAVLEHADKDAHEA